MSLERNEKRFLVGKASRTGLAGALAGVLTGVVILAPVAGAAPRIADQRRIVSERSVDRARLEQLQRWVSAGHADWCKDARLVASEEMWRVAPDFSGDGLELDAVEENSPSGSQDANRLTYEWLPADGRAVYRVTVQRFAWLLPIAKDIESIVWVPTSTEIRTQQ